MANLPDIRREQGLDFNRRSRDPIQAMMQMHREMDQLFNSFFGGESIYPAMSRRSFGDTEETDSHYLMSFDMPGLSKNDVKIEVRDNALHIFGERSDETKGRGGAKERFYGSYDQWVSLPANVNADQIEAEVENGVLRLAIPKGEESKTKQIKIGEGKGFFSKLLGKKEAASENKRDSAA